MSDKLKQAKCAVTGCINEAHVQVGFRVYAAGHEKIKRNSIEGWLGIAVCDFHSEHTKPEGVLTPQGIAKINAQLVAMKRAPVDAATAEIMLKPLTNGKMATPNLGLWTGK